MNKIRKYINKIAFEYIFLVFIISSALLLELTSSFLTPLIIVLICIFFAWKINLAKGIVCIAAILLLMLCNFIRSCPSDDSLKEKLQNHPIHGRIIFEIIDPLCCSLPDIRNGATIKVRIHEISTIANEKYYGNGTFLIYAENLLPEQSMYGDIFAVEGTLRFRNAAPAWDESNAALVHDFRFGNFNHYMQFNNIDGMIAPEKGITAEKISSCDSLFRRLLLIRDRTLAYVCANFKNNDNKNLTAALFFGLKGALDRESKQQFIKSGTIHLFSVSGLHVGILFAILLPILAFLPVRLRYLAGTFLLIPFLLTTGYNIPALRAFLMILTFALLRFFCFQTTPLKIVAFYCGAFLICNTANLSDAGFLYSFGITAILLQCADTFTRWRKIWNTDCFLTASNRKNPARSRHLHDFMLKIIFAACCTAAAFAGSSIITLYSFGYLYFAAVWINFFILFYCSYLTVFFIINIVLGHLGFIGEYTAVCFEKMLDFMREVIRLGSNYPLQINTIQISYFQALLFYTALFLILCVRNKKIFTCSLVFLIMFMPFNTLLNNLQKNEILLIREPSNNTCAFIIANVQGNYAVCCNISNSESMELARKFLSAKGINHLNIFILPGSAKNQLNALKNAVNNMKIGKVIHISRSKLPDDFHLPSDTAYEHIKNSSASWTLDINSCRFFRKKAQIGFEYFNTEAIIPLCISFDSENQILRIGNETKFIQTNSNLLEYSVYEL